MITTAVLFLTNTVRIQLYHYLYVANAIQQRI